MASRMIPDLSGNGSVARGMACLILAITVGCAERPKDEKTKTDLPRAEHQQAQAERVGLGGGPEGPKNPESLAEKGPLQGEWEYLLCFQDKDNPLNTWVLLRNKAHRSVDFQVRERKIRHEEFQLDFFVHSADQEELVYWTETPETRYNLKRVRGPGHVEAAAGILAGFVGSVTALPVLYDARTGFAERTVPVPTDVDDLEVTRVKGLLSSQGMALNEGLLDGGR